MAAGPAPDRCENCGFASKYSRQEKGETPAYCTNHGSWLCAGCRDYMGCTAASHRIEGIPPRIDVTGIPPNDGIYSAIDDEVYHSDLASLSSSGARALLSTTPEEFDFNRRSARREPNRNFDFGHAAHKMVLGKGSRIAMLDPKVCGHGADGKLAKVPSATAEWKHAAATARQQGKVPLAKSDIEKAQTMAGRVFQHKVASRLLAEGQAEHSIYWHDDATGIRLRARPDFLSDGLARPICNDYKTATSADPKQFQRAVVDYGYHMQQAFYEDALAEIGIVDAGFLFIVQSKSAPYSVSVCAINPEIVELGRRQNRAAIELYARCIESDRWPGYEGIHAVGMPGWAVKQIEDSLEGPTP